MKSMIKKSTVREIRQSFGRFAAILAIVALGVAFFAGLKVTQSAMLATTQKYWEETDFYDYRLLSSLGFTEDEVESFREQQDVKAAEGAVSFDIICQADGGSEQVLKAHSITVDVNRLVVTEGALPQEADECVVDAALYDSSMIGKTITLSEENEDEDLDHFTYREYTVTGLVQSPLYIQFERGTTSLGNGRVSGFMYLLPEGFTDDYYTEAYIKFDDSFALYSDEYDAYMDEKESVWEDLTTDAAEARYDKLVKEAQDEVDDGKAELADKKAEAEAEFADAKQELDDAKAQIADGEQQIADAKNQLEEASTELDSQEAVLNQTEQELAAQEAQLNASEGMMDAQQAAQARAQIEGARQQIAEGRAGISAAREQIESSRQEVQEQEAELNDAKEEYEEGQKEYEENLETYQQEIADAEQEIADAEQEIADIEEPEGYVFGRETNVGYVCFESDSGIVDGIANIFPVFFFLVAALVCITTMNRMVEEQRTQIGVLKALGYGEGTIMSKYMFYSGSAALLGCIIGFFAGTYLFPKIIWYAYGIMYQVDSLLYIFDVKLAVISLVVSLLCSVGTTWVSCRYELSEVAAELMRPKAPKAGKRVLLERVPFIWKRLKFLQKVSIRNIFRYKKRFFMMVIGISGCTALLVTGFGVRDSVTGIAEQQYTEIQIYDISVTYSKAVGEDDEERLKELSDEGVKAYTFVSENSMDLVGEDKTKSVSVVTARTGADMTPFLNLHTTGQEPITYPEKGKAVISHKIAQDFGIEAGDTVTLRDEDQNELKLQITGVCKNFVYNYIYISADTYEEQMGIAPEYKTAYVNATEDTDSHLLGTRLMSLDGVASVSVSQDDMERFSSMMSSMNLIVVVIIFCAAGLAFIVLYNLTNINITERVREIATIKVLGFYEKETSSYVFRENNMLSFLGALVGLGLGVLLHRFVMSQITVDMVAFDVRIEPLSYLYSVILTLVFAALVHRLMKKKIDCISMTESLKSVD